MTLEKVIEEHVLKVLSESPTKIEAARRLGISIRTLRNYLHNFGREDLLGPSPKELRLKKYFPEIYAQKINGAS